MRKLLLLVVLCLALGALAPAQKGKPAPGALTAKSYVVMEAESGKVLRSSNPNAKRFPASTTKILTTLLLLEHCEAEERIRATSEVETIEGSSLHLKAGETVSATDMAYALLLRSANDGCYATAMHISGSVEKFAELMNQRAKEIGCTNSHFANPNGLPDPNHTTTAMDLARIAREAMKNERFREIAHTRKHQVSRDLNLEDTWLISKNKFLAWDPTNEGIKTGYTAAAGQCFVGASTRKGMRILTVVLASKDWKNDYKSLNDWAFAHYKLSTYESAGTKVGAAEVMGGAKATVGLALEGDVKYPSGGASTPNLKMKVYGIKGLSAPIKKGQRAGSAIFSDGSGWNYTAPLVAVEEVGYGSLVARATHMHWSSYALAGMLGVGAIAVRKKARRMASGARRG